MSTELSSPAGEVVLARHGQGECNAAGVIGGRLGCSGLSARGREESSRLADRLARLDADRRFDALLSSPRPRVVECAQIISSRLARPVVVIEALRGQEFGAADGRPWDQVVRGFGGSPMQDPDRPIAEGAEAWNAYAERVLAALRAVLAEHAGQRVLLVGHGKTTGLAGALLSGAADPRSGAAGFVVDHGALSIWRQSPRGWALLVHNDTGHLMPSLPRGA
ncbi:MAG: histidine phosphatase family protein [Kineosporiaceae bacterium]